MVNSETYCPMPPTLKYISGTWTYVLISINIDLQHDNGKPPEQKPDVTAIRILL